ncbi:elongation factor Ts [Firmicutes bacterium CAG:552]|nr:elongation factor Ts [Firmicutes bacterium CAG:552]
MAFTAKDVAALREITGAGMMDCKKALTHTEGDMDKAAEYLREQGISVAAKKASRIASEGVVMAYTSEDGRQGSLVELNCESDFVARGEGFVSLAEDIAKQVVAIKPANNEELLDSKIGDRTVSEFITATTAKTGEKVSFRRFAYQHAAKEEAYIHMGGKIGVLLEVDTDKDVNSNEEFNTMCHDIAMHIAAMSPSYLYNEEVPAADVEHEKEILRIQQANDPKNAKKPPEVLEKMIVGRLGKFYKEVCLIDQEFVKDSSLTIRQLVEKVGKSVGAKITLKKFTRFVMGEGLEKRNENFAEEIAKMSAK